MFMNFGHGKCPLCGDFGARIAQKRQAKMNDRNFNCKNCNAVFDNFCLFMLDAPKEQNKFWN